MYGIKGVLALFLLIFLFPYVLLLFPIYYFMAIRGREGRALAAQQKINAILMPGEQMIEHVAEYRIDAIFRRRQLLAITNDRIIILDRAIFGGYTMSDRPWKDIDDVQLSELTLPNIFGSFMQFSFVKSRKLIPGNPNTGNMVVAGIDSEIASRIYSYAQSQEQAWQEKRRVRNIEESRAAAGGVHLYGATAPASTGPMVDSSKIDLIAEELSKAKKMVEAGIISDVEYQEIKSKILSRQY